MNLLTIGFTKKNAEKFFGLLRSSGASRLIDVRLNNSSQLAGFAKKDDLKFFLREICNISYSHAPDLAPTDEILRLYKMGEISWEVYSDKFLNLMTKRNIERCFDVELLRSSCLLCSEHEPHFCHRRLVAEYLKEHGCKEIEIKHLF